MLKGKRCTVRHMRADDLPRYLEMTTTLETRGEYFPSRVKSPHLLAKEFADNGFSTDDFERLAIVNHDGDMVGEICHFKVRASYTREIGYWLFDQRFGGRGYVSEAVALVADYLFLSRPMINRLEILMVPENTGSERVAQKCGFRKEGLLREYAFMNGRYCDTNVYSLLRHEWKVRQSDMANAPNQADR